MGIFNLPAFHQVLILTLGSMSLGIVLCFSSPTISQISTDYQLSESRKNLFISIPSLTAIIGTFISPILIDFGGKRFSVRIVSSILAFSWFLFVMASPNSSWLLICHRLLAGISIGAYSAMIPLCINDVSPVPYKSILGTLHQLGIVFGALCVNLLGAYLNYLTIVYLFLLIPIALCVLISFVPEKANITQRSNKSNLFSKSNLPGLYQGLCFMAFQQFSGINAVMSNLGLLFPDAKLVPAFASSAQGFSCLVSMSIIEKLGRSRTYGLSSLGAALSLFFFAIFLSFSSLLAGLCAFLFQFFFCLGLGPIPWFVTPQLFSEDARNSATAFLSGTNWLFSFITVYTYNPLVNAFGIRGTLTIYGLVMIASTIYSKYGLDSSTPKVSEKLDVNQEEENIFEEESNPQPLFQNIA